MFGNQDDVPKYSGTLVSVNSGNEITMNGMIISVISIDGSGNGYGLIKAPMMGNVKLDLKLEGIKIAKGDCIVEGKANLSGI